MKKEQKRSPLTEEPLRLPGEYLHDELGKIFNEQFFPAFGVATMVVGFAVVEWLYYLLGTSRQLHPWILTMFAVVVSVCTYIYFEKLKKKILNYQLGYDGEVFVGQLLEGLRLKGFIPIHDVPCESNGVRFNIDHILVGPKGIFAVETKTWSKNSGQNEKIGYVNGHILAGASFRDDKSVVQAKINAEWMEKLFLSRTGQQVPVHPVLLFPGWFVEQVATDAVKNKYGVLMLTPKALEAFLDQYTDVFNQEEVQSVAMVISSYVHEEVMKQK